MGTQYFMKEWIEEKNMNESDSLAELAWTGNYIEYLESQTQTNDIINEIVDQSISERILSLYTAFLCLEPSRGGKVCYDCMDESKLVSIENQLHVIQSDSILFAYPNPFNDRVEIKVNLPETQNSMNVTMRIYNILGQVVRNFDDFEHDSVVRSQYTWDGKNNPNIQLQKEKYPEDFCNEPTQRRLDYIFYKGPGLKAVMSKVILNKPVHGIYISDHYGVMAEFKLADEK